MKKVLITMCAAIAVLACTKTEVAFDEPNEIAFSPVSRYATKAAVASGESVGQNFYAWANTVETNSQAYFANILFTPETNGSTVYVGSQYWPNNTPLKFAGVTASGNIGTVIPSMTAWGTISVDNYNQPAPETKSSNDLMWFFDDNNTTGYTKSSTTVTPPMSHACSWISIKVKVDAALVSYWTNIKVKGISFDNLHLTGNVALAESASWTVPNSGATSNVEIYSDQTGINITSTASAAIENVADNVIVIPQTPTTISLTYSYTTPAGGAVTEIVSGISLDYDGDDDANAAWEAGKHYTYTLTIGADEIKIAPTSGDWDDYDADSNTDGDQPIDKEVE